MKKFLISFFTISIVFWLNVTHANDGRVCETIYSVINWVKYFSSIHCTEDIKLTWVIADESSLSDVSQRTLNDFIIANNTKITAYIDEWNSCKDISELEAIQEFETVIYSNNDISYTTTTSEIEALTESIEELMEKYNDPDLYNEVYDEVQVQYPVWSVDFLKSETRVQYFDKQLEIKEEILDNQEEKLTLLYKISASQEFIDDFYNEINKICESYYKTKWWDSTEEEKEKAIEDNIEIDDDAEDELIEQYKEEFNVKLWSVLDAMPKQDLKKLSVKLLDYAENSPIFKRFSEKEREIVNLKIKGLKAAIDQRIED